MRSSGGCGPAYWRDLRNRQAGLGSGTGVAPVLALLALLGFFWFLFGCAAAFDFFRSFIGAALLMALCFRDAEDDDGIAV